MVDEHTSFPNFFDLGYDLDAEAFLFARVDFVAIGSGTTNLETMAGAIGIVHDGQTVNPIFGSATIHVIPEPTALAILICFPQLWFRRLR